MHKKSELVTRFQDPEVIRLYVEQAQSFGDSMAALLRTIGADNRFLRLLVV